MGEAPEWDIVAEDVNGKRLLLGEAKLASDDLDAMAAAVAERSPPALPAKYRRHDAQRALFVPDAGRRIRIGGVAVVSLRHLVGRTL
jgi:hypothetical protein